MVIYGIDAGLTAPGFAVVETSEEKPIGEIRHVECFIPEWKLNDKGRKAQIRKTDQDSWRIRQIVKRMFELAIQYKPDVIIAELPTGGAQSGGAIRGMAFSTAMTVAFLESLETFKDYYLNVHNKNWPTEVVTITPIENKKGSTGRLKWDVPIEQGKWEIMTAVDKIWPGIEWPRKKRLKTEYDDGLCWGMADSLSCVATYLRRKGTLPPWQ
jgi:hypothetical protein